MAFNGSGVFTRLYNWANDAAASIKIRADRFDAEMDGFATGLSTCMTKDGQQLPTAAQNFNGQNLTNVGAFSTTGTNTFSGTTTLFSGTAARIQGDFSNATIASRTSFQDKTTNSTTALQVLPNGTSTQSGVNVFNNSDPTNATYAGVYANNTTVGLSSGVTGTGSLLPIVIGISGTEVARFLTANGQMCIGTTSVPASGGHVSINNPITGQYGFSITTPSQSGVYYFASFKASLAASQIGAIVSNDGTSTNYQTTSDYRLKQNVQPMTGALAKVQALNPVTYKWKSTGQSGQGFIAHELQTIIPEAVSGVKDDVDENGDPRYQGIDASHVVATLVAAIKELTARVATLEARA
jgi:hypothetical protein